MAPSVERRGDGTGREHLCPTRSEDPRSPFSFVAAPLPWDRSSRFKVEGEEVCGGRRVRVCVCVHACTPRTVRTGSRAFLSRGLQWWAEMAKASRAVRLPRPASGTREEGLLGGGGSSGRL